LLKHLKQTKTSPRKRSYHILPTPFFNDFLLIHKLDEQDIKQQCPQFCAMQLATCIQYTTAEKRSVNSTNSFKNLHQNN